MKYIILFIVATIVIAFFVIKRLISASKESTESQDPNHLVIFEVRTPKKENATSEDFRIAPLAAESMFASLHGLLKDDPTTQEQISFEIASSDSGMKFYVACPYSIHKFVESQIYAHYSYAQVIETSDYTQRIKNRDLFFGSSEITLSKETFFPINTFRDFEVDPLSSITSSLTGVMPGEEIWIQLVIKPLPDIWQGDGHDYVNAVRSGKILKQKPILNQVIDTIVTELGNVVDSFIKNVTNPMRDANIKATYAKSEPVRLSAGQELQLKGIENKLSKMGFEVGFRVLSFSQDKQRVTSNLRSVYASLRQFSSSNINSFTSDNDFNDIDILARFINRHHSDGKTFVLNTEELASIYHFPTSNVETPNISWVHSKKSEPPINLPTENCCYIGETIYRNKRVKFGLSNDLKVADRLRHMYLIGKSGTGKSTLYRSMITQDINNGFGVGVIDPHGELIDQILDTIPDHRVDDVILIDPSDTERPVGLNFLELHNKEQKNLMASALVSAIKVHFDYTWGPRLEYLLNWSILTLLEVPGTTMMGITRLLQDQNYLKYILYKVSDPVVIRFWEEEYKEFRGNQKLVTEAIAPIQNKINRFLSSSTIRNILVQGKSTIDIGDAMNSGKILLVNLSKGKIGEDNANLLGALIVSRIQFMALQRANIPESKRRPFYLYVDEFQNFTTGSFESILSESRKYKLGLYLTHQYTSQIPEDVLNAVFGNVGTIASFSLGAPDAKVLANEFQPYFDEQDIISLERFNIYLKLMIDGMTSLPFSAKILLPWEQGDQSIFNSTGNKEKVIRLSRSKYGTDKYYVEEKIGKWVSTQFDKGMAIAQEMKAKKANETQTSSKGSFELSSEKI